MYTAILTFSEAHAQILSDWAEPLGWTFNQSAQSPYSNAHGTLYCSLTLEGKGSERLLEDLLHAQRAFEAEGIGSLREQIICTVYDSKTGEDWISDSDESELQRAVEEEGLTS